MDYVQMPLEDGKESVECLYFCAMIANKDIENTKNIPKDTVLKAIECYFKYAFDNANIENNRELLLMQNNNKDKDSIDLLRLL